MAIKIMSIGAHNDECEYCTGGLSWILHKAGCDILYVNPACLWHKPDIDEETKALYSAQEQAAAKVLGAKKLVIGDRDGQIMSPSTELIVELEKIILDYDPDIILIHWPLDNHVEHRMVAKLSYEALSIAYVHGAHFKEVYAYESGLNQTTDYFHPDFIVDIEESMDAIKESCFCFDQNTASGFGLYDEKYKQAAMRGCQLRMNYGEGKLCDPLPKVATGEQVAGAFSYMNKQELALIICGSLHNPLEIDWIRVWQK